MKLIIDKRAIDRNIIRAEKITGVEVSLMLKSFYEYLHTSEMNSRKLFSANIEGSICYSIGDARKLHRGAVVTSEKDVESYYNIGIKSFYIPINAYDNREGLSIPKVIELARYIKNYDCSVFGMITSGCIRKDAPEIEEISKWWLGGLNEVLSGISIGGSFYISKLKEYLDYCEIETDLLGFTHEMRRSIPAYITDIRIGEYALFGTIPYCDDVSLRGDNALTVEMNVVGVHRERGDIVVKGGYSQIDTAKCSLLSGGLTYVSTSSEYTVYKDLFKRYEVGDVIEVVPDYYSLVKLQYVERECK